MNKKRGLLISGVLALLCLAGSSWASPNYDDYYAEEFLYHHGDSIGGVGGGNEGAAYVSAAGNISRLVFQQLVLPSAETASEKSNKANLNLPRTFGASAYWEDVDFENANLNGDIYGVNLGVAFDNDQLTYGLMLPYDYIDFDSFDGHRVGLIGFTQYSLPLNQTLSASFTGHINYCYTDLDFDFVDADEVNLFGGGLGAAITYDNDIFIFSAGTSYLYNTDDSDADDDEQHLIKTGINAGVRNGDNGVINLFAVWNADVTDYDNDPADDDYYEVGCEGSLTLTDTFGLSLGYKKVLELEDFDADEIYLGSTWKF